MKKTYSIILVYGIIFLFFIQLAGTLVESIYILDLMNSTLDEKALGVLFFFSPILFIPFYKKFPRVLFGVTFAILLLGRGTLPYLITVNRMPASGFGTGAAVSLFFLLLAARPKRDTYSQNGLWGSAGLALAVSLSVLLRTLGSGLDYSLIPAGGWVGWGLGLTLGWLLTQLDWKRETAAPSNKYGSVTPAIVGFFLVLTLVWFSFSAPAVIARWTEGNYTLIVMAVSLFAIGWVLLSLSRSHLLEQISPRGLLLWNLLFTISLTVTILAHRVPFPPTPDSASVVVTTPSPFARIPLVLMLLLFPVIFLDLQLFLNQIQQAKPTPRDLIPGILLGNLVLVLLVFAHIFTNVWGYVEPVSPFFRNKFWLPYFLLTGLIAVLTWRMKKTEPAPEQKSFGVFHWGWAIMLGAIFLLTAISALPAKQTQDPETNRSSLVVMTFNTQQSNDEFGEKSYDKQLALIQKASPDILALQESDSTRISLNNNDYVRYFAEKLGYYSYYGPTTVTGTYGTAILSKYPLLNTRTVFSYSDQDEIGIAEAEIDVNGRRFTIYNVHPDGSDTAMLVFAQTLLKRSKDKPYVIALGDYNLRDYEEAYQLIDNVYTNAWVSVYPSEISVDGIDMSGENRIDHIFISPEFKVHNPVYVLPPASATDHPIHWAEIYWEDQ
jgi:endonuclease/exonuclease/phosphatase family metal-dependent hydrolase